MILRTRGGQREVRALDLTGVLPARGTGGYAAGMVRIDNTAANGLPAFDAAIRIAAEAVAAQEMQVWRNPKSPTRQLVTGAWQSRFLASAPNPRQTWGEFWSLSEASMTARRNTYWWRTVVNGSVQALWALHPDQVQVVVTRAGKSFRVAMGGGWIDPLEGNCLRYVDADCETVAHTLGPGGWGLPVAPTPIEAFRATMGAAIAQQQWQEGFYQRGTGGGLVLSFPADIQPVQAERAKRMWDESNGGVLNAHGTRVISGGATITPVSVSQSDAQFIETHALTVQDVARITGVTASLIGGAATTTQASAPITPEHEMTRWVHYGLQPRLRRWEEALCRDPGIFGPGTAFAPRFTPPDIHADTATQTASDVALVQSGIEVPDEPRARRGLPPLPDGVGQIPQIVPVGGSPHGVPDATTPPPDTAPAPTKG